MKKLKDHLDNMWMYLTLALSNNMGWIKIMLSHLQSAFMYTVSFDYHNNEGGSNFNPHLQIRKLTVSEAKLPRSFTF